MLKRCVTFLAVAAGFFPTVTAQTRYEVENSPAICPGTIMTDHSGYSGSGFCNAPNQAGVAVQFTVNAPSSGSATLSIRYANGNPVGRPADITINGAQVQTGFAFDHTGGWNRWADRVFTANLNSGSNTIRIIGTNGNLANIDCIDVTTGGGTTPPPGGARPMENLGRGVVAVRSATNSVLVSWRLLGLDPANIGFNVYRGSTKINSDVLTAGTNFVDTGANLAQANTYTVRPVVNGAEQAASKGFTLPANNAVEPIVRIPVRATGPIKFVWVGDLDGDGEYDYVVDRQTSPQKIEAYRSDGTFLWDVDLGPNSVNQDNISPGSSTIDVGHNDGVTVYDFDSDGRAEVAIRIANGVRFGNGQVFSNSDNNNQFIAILDGRTGALRSSAQIPTDYKSTGPLAARFGVGYLDGTRPHLISFKKNRQSNGAFNLMICAWVFENNAVSMRWKWLRGNTDAPDGHNTRSIDVDGDGRDEVAEIGFVLNGDGTMKYSLASKGIIHGDRFHIAKIDPSRSGLQGFGVQQDNPSRLLEYYYDAGTGNMIWQHFGSGVADVGRGMVGDIDARHSGMEVWSFNGLYNARSNTLAEPNAGLRPWPHLGLWWDGDILMELYNDGKIEKWDPNNPTATNATPRLETISRYGAINTGGVNPAFIGDIMGDWREEVIVSNSAYNQLIIFSTNRPSDIRLYTLAHNPAYRNAMTFKGYMQSHHVDYFLGSGMSMPPPRPNIRYAGV